MPTVVAPARPSVTVTPKPSTPVTPKASTITPKPSISTPKSSATVPKTPVVVVPSTITSSHENTSDNSDKNVLDGGIIGLILFGVLLICVLTFISTKKKW
jgi:tellurite resistance protein TehA-like permease